MESPVSSKWDSLLRLIPSYDPFSTAGDCVFVPEQAQLALDFFPECLKHIEGGKAATPFILEPWQQAIVANLFGWQRPDGTRRYREAFIFVPRKNGKALALNTPVPTPTGWTTMGAIAVGDTLYADTGEPCRVLEVHPIRHNHRCYRVEFSDGTNIVADAEHLWAVQDRYADNATRIKTTEEIAATHLIGNRATHKERRYRVGVTTLQAPTANLPIDPYVLGAWLGDGDSDCARITLHEDDSEILERLAACGTASGPLKRDKRSEHVLRVRLGSATPRAGMSRAPSQAPCLQKELRSLNVLNNKHIPPVYLRASVAQRLQLLRGLMDTDGYASKAGQCEFVSVHEQLFRETVELTRSLGFKPTVKIDRAQVNGMDCGPRYRMQFWAYEGMVPFSLERKRARARVVPNWARSRTRQITNVVPVESVPVRCIRVDSASHLFLAGEGMVPTHNTPLVAGICNYVLFCDNEPGAQIYLAAAEREQAALVYRHAKGMIEQEPELAKRARVYRALKSITLNEDEGSVLKVLSADADTKHGGNSHLVVVDELHAQPNRELIDVLQTSMASSNRRQPMMIYITTSDYDRESICNEKHDYAGKVRDGIIKDAAFLPVIFEALPKDDWTSPEVWKKANPNLGVSVSLEYLQRECKRAQETPSYENTFKRLHLNIRTEQDVRWLQMDAWDRCKGLVDADDLKGQECYGGLDLSSISDLTAFVLFFPESAKCLCWFWLPEDAAEIRDRRDRVPYLTWAREGYIELTPDNRVDYAYVRRRINELVKLYDVKDIGFDPYNATQLSLQLQEQDGIEMVEFRQGFISMNEPCKHLERYVLGGELQHGGNPVLRWMASNAVVKVDEAGNMKMNKAKCADKIDGMVALAMAIGRSDVTTGGSVYDHGGLQSL